MAGSCLFLPQAVAELLNAGSQWLQTLDLLSLPWPHLKADHSVPGFQWKELESWALQRTWHFRRMKSGLVLQSYSCSEFHSLVTVI